MGQGMNIAGGALTGASAGLKIGGPWGAAIGAVAGGVLGALEDNPIYTPYKYNPANVTQGQYQFLQQGDKIGDVSGTLAQANAIDNASYQGDASEFAPNLLGNIKQQGANTTSALQGQLTPGVQAALGKPGASARDLGLTSAQLQQGGAGRLGGELNAATSLNPYNETATDTLISPSALLQRQDQKDLYNNNILNQNALANYQSEQSNDWAKQALGMIGSLGGGMSGGGGGGGGGISSMLGGI
jgi:hypothetical protein